MKLKGKKDSSLPEERTTKLDIANPHPSCINFFKTVQLPREMLMKGTKAANNESQILL